MAFTLKKYQNLLHTLKTRGFSFYTFRSEVRDQKSEGKGQREEEMGTSAGGPFRESKGKRGSQQTETDNVETPAFTPQKRSGSGGRASLDNNGRVLKN